MAKPTFSSKASYSGFSSKASYSGFACSCGTDNEAKMTTLHAWVSTTFRGWAPENYVTGMLYTLAGNYEAWIDGIPLDPGGWGAIEASTGKRGPQFSTYVQFDRFEDGLALTLQAFYKRFGKQRKVR